MKDLLDKFQDIVIQITTSHSKEGTGFYWADYQLIVTSEHIIRDHKEVIIEGKNLEQQIVEVLFIDQKYDLAFLNAPDHLYQKHLHLNAAKNILPEAEVLAVGHPFGESFAYAKGSLIADSNYPNYIQHNAILSNNYNGGPLFNLQGELVGINAFLPQEQSFLGFALPASKIEETIVDFLQGKGKKGSRCIDCESIIFEAKNTTKYCPNCGSFITMISLIEEYEPTGVSKTIEGILTKTKHDAKLSRRGLNNWEIKEGSANVMISYHEDSGLITGDAYLCLLPKNNAQNIYQFLLRQNKIIEGLTFSINPNGRDIILSLLIYDRYLNIDTGIKLFQHLFERADYYDNILVEEYGAVWKK